LKQGPPRKRENMITRYLEKTKLWALAAALAFFGGILFATPLIATAETAQEAVCIGLGEAVGRTGTTDCADPAGESSLGDTVKAVIDILALVVAVVSVIMIIVGGMKYVTSQGDSSGVSAAKNTVIYAVVGLVIVAMAQIIVRFTVNRATSPAATPPAATEPATDPCLRPNPPTRCPR
jgi:hypothetical protein